MSPSMRVGAFLVLGLGLGWAGTASAQEAGTGFGSKGQFAVGAERLFGIVFTSRSQDNVVGGVNVTTTNKYTNVNLLVNATGPITTGYAVPRISFDYFVINGLGVGGSIGYFHVSGSVKQEGGGQSVTQDTGTANGFLLAPRVGYAFMFTPMLGIWPRGGITFVHSGSEDTDGYPNSSSNALALTLEVPFVITPVPHVGFQVAPIFDIGLSGSDKVTTLNGMGQEVTTKTDVKTTDLGLQAGMFVYF